MDKKINLKRMLEDLENLRQFGRTPQGGVSRQPFAGPDKLAREYLLKQAAQYGLQGRVDALSNIIIGYKGKSQEKKTLILASHYDSVINGGAYDGILGVVSGLEILRVLAENTIELKYPIELVAFNDEEGSRFGTGFSGSKAFTGLLTQDDLDNSIDAKGISLAQAMEKAGFDPQAYKDAIRNKEEILGYLELHIEQGPVLENLSKEIGIVTGIVGSCRYSIRVTGRADHAGTTPMNMRLDPLQPCAKLWAELPALAKIEDDDAVATVGSIVTKPGASNVVANSIEFTLDVRSLEKSGASKTSQLILQKLKEYCGIDYNVEIKNLKTLQQEEPTPMSYEIISTIEAAAQELEASYHFMGSGAGHDAELFADLCPTGMIFVPSKDGRSHSPLEYTKPEHIEKGAQVMMATVLKLLQKLN